MALATRPTQHHAASIRYRRAVTGAGVPHSPCWAHHPSWLGLRAALAPQWQGDRQWATIFMINDFVDFQHLGWSGMMLARHVFFLALCSVPCMQAAADTRRSTCLEHGSMQCAHLALKPMWSLEMKRFCMALSCTQHFISLRQHPKTKTMRCAPRADCYYLDIVNALFGVCRNCACIRRDSSNLSCDEVTDPAPQYSNQASPQQPVLQHQQASLRWQTRQHSPGWARTECTAALTSRRSSSARSSAPCRRASRAPRTCAGQDVKSM
jgi:hypothetical protein